MGLVYMKAKQTLQHDVLMRSIKMLDIGFITIVYIALALLASKGIDTVMGEFDPEKEAKKPFWRRTLEMVVLFWLFGVLIYIVRNIVQHIPFPLNGVQGFDHFRVSELGSAEVFSIAFVIFNNNIKKMMEFYYHQL